MEKVEIYIIHDAAVKPIVEAHFMYNMVFVKDGKESGNLVGFGKVDNAGEKEVTLDAMIDSLSHMNRKIDIDIYIPSVYIYSVIEKTTYLQKWKDKGYEYIKHAHLWQQITELLEKYNVKVIFQKDHKYKDWMIHEMKVRKESKC